MVRLSASRSAYRAETCEHVNQARGASRRKRACWHVCKSSPSVTSCQRTKPFPSLKKRSFYIIPCDLAAQGSSRCSSGNLIAARQANLAARLRLGGYAPSQAPTQKQPLRGTHRQSYKVSSYPYCVLNGCDYRICIMKTRTFSAHSPPPVRLPPQPLPRTAEESRQQPPPHTRQGMLTCFSS